MDSSGEPGEDSHRGSATILFIYIFQHTDFNHYSRSQAFVFVADKSTLSHPKINIPHIGIMDFSVCLIQKEKKKYFIAITLPHPTRWRDCFSGTIWFVHRAQQAINRITWRTRSSQAQRTGLRSKAQTKTCSESATSQKHRVRKLKAEFPRSFYGLSKAHPVCPSCPNQHCSDLLFRDEG